MKIRILLLVFTLYVHTSFSQGVELVASKVEISNYDNNRIESGVVSMDYLQGPFMIVHCKIMNHTNNSITIQPSKAKYQLSYKYEREIYIRKLFPLAFTDNTSLTIESGEGVEFTVDEWLFIGTPMFDMKKRDYLLDLVKVLPTIEITYRDGNHQLSSKGIGEVVVKE